uniref:Cyclin B3 n=1 Tax=Myotis myotis TaxID=51298 RepID=A0A7J7YCH1_MYOMY|nr:cyclin B3 [Myotis myotis]
MPPPPGSDKNESKKSQSNKIVPRDHGQSEKRGEDYQAVISPSSSPELLKKRSALDDLTNASQSPPAQPKKEANKEVVKDISKKINKNTTALELARNNAINIKKYELELSSSAVSTMVLNFVEKPLTVNISTISKAPTTEEASLLKKPLVLKEKPTTRNTTHIKRSLSLKKDINWNKTSEFVEPLSLLGETESDFEFVSEPVTFGNKHETGEATFAKRTLSSTKLYISQEKQFCCVKELTSLDNNIEKDSFVEPMNFRKKPKTEESTTTERLLTLNKCTTQEKVSYKRKPLILQKATSREKLLNEEPFPFENKSTTKQFGCVKEMTSLDNNIAKDTFMEPMDFRKKPKTEESTSTERLLTLNKCTTQEKVSYKRKPLILQKATSREKLLNEEPFPFENKSTTKQFSRVKKMTPLDNNIEEDSFVEPMDFRKKPKTEESTTTKGLLTLNKCTPQEKVSYKRKPLILQKATSREKLLNEEPFPFENKSTTKQFGRVKEMTSLDNNIEEDSFVEPMDFRKKPKTEESTTTKGLLTLNKCTPQEKVSYKRKPLILQKATSREKLLNEEPFPFENKSTTKQFGRVKEMTSLDNNIEEDSFVEPMDFRKKPKTEESTTTERLLTLNKYTTQEKMSYKRKPLILQKATSREKLLNEEPFPFQNKSTTKQFGRVKEMTSLDNNIEEDSFVEPMDFRKKPKTEESTTTKGLLTLNKCTPQEKVSYKRKPLILQKATSREKLLNEEPFPFETKSTTKQFLFQEPFLLQEKHTTEGDMSVLKKPLALQKNPTEEDSLLKEPLAFKKKRTMEKATPNEVLVFAKRRTTEDKLSCLKKPLVLQAISEEKSLIKEPLSFKKKPTTEEEFLFKGSSMLLEKHTTQGEAALLKKPRALQENIHSKDEFLMEPVSCRKKHTTNEAISSKEPLSLNKRKYTTQIMMPICQEVLDLQNMIGKDKDFFVMKPGPFRKQSSTEEAIDKTLLSLKKKHITDTKEDSLKKRLIFQEKSTTEEDFLLKKPLIRKKKLSTEAIISTESQLSLKEKSTAQGEVFLLKKQLSLQQKPSIEKDPLIIEELTFQGKPTIDDSFNLKMLNKKSTTRKKLSFEGPLTLQDNPTQKEDTFLKDLSTLQVNNSSHVFNSPPESQTGMANFGKMTSLGKYKTKRKYSARKSSSKKRFSYWRHISKKKITILEIIDGGHYDPYFNLAYTKDIFNYMKAREEKFRLKNYMRSQTEINSDMRVSLVNWLVKIQVNCNLNHESLYLAVKLVDHYLMKKKCKEENLQLLGATAFLIAAKLEETGPPKLDRFLQSRREGFQRHEMVAMEISILSTLKFEINIPVAYHFLRIFSMTHFLNYYFDFVISDLYLLVKKLNTLLTLYPCNDRLKTVCFKYSHPNFYEVTKIPPLDKLKLEEILHSR